MRRGTLYWGTVNSCRVKVLAWSCVCDLSLETSSFLAVQSSFRRFTLQKTNDPVWRGDYRIGSGNGDIQRESTAKLMADGRGVWLEWPAGHVGLFMQVVSTELQVGCRSNNYHRARHEVVKGRGGSLM